MLAVGHGGFDGMGRNFSGTGIVQARRASVAASAIAVLDRAAAVIRCNSRLSEGKQTETGGRTDGLPDSLPIS
jgi:hypothetical protein